MGKKKEKLDCHDGMPEEDEWSYETDANRDDLLDLTKVELVDLVMSIRESI